MQSYIFIAGGIGITPFRSIIHDLLDKKKKVPITLFYQVNNKDEILFYEVFEQAEKELGLQIISIIGEKLSKEHIIKNAPNFKEKIFYISGPQGMVEDYRTMIESMGVPFEQIKTDLFTGYA